MFREKSDMDCSDHGRRTNRRNILKVAGSAGIAGLAGCTGNITGGSGGDYPSEEIRWIVPYSTGGLFDGLARLFAQDEYLPQHLPNEVDVVVENVTGGGGRRGATETYRADPDGYTIGWWNIPGFAISQLMEDVSYDVNEVSWISRIAKFSFTIVVGPDSEFDSIEDLQNSDEPISFASTGFASSGFQFAVVAADRLGIEPEFVSGYEGAAEARTAVQRGDADALVTNAVASKSMIEEGNLKPVLMIAPETPEFMSGTENLSDIGEESLADVIGIHFILGAPPETPDERTQILSDSLESAVNSDQFESWAEEKSLQQAVAFTGPERTSEIIQNTTDTYESFVDTFREYRDE